MIEVNDGDYCIGLWFVYGDHKDWMGGVVRKKNTETFEFKYRFRYYADSDPFEDPFSDKDRRNWYSGTVNPDQTEADIIASMNDLAKFVSRGPGFYGKYDVALVQGGYDKLVKAMTDKPWLHMQKGSSAVVPNVPEPKGNN